MEPGGFTRPARGRDGCAPRKFRIRTEDLERLGHAANCPGRRAANRGTAAANFGEECRKRIEGALGKIGDEGIERERTRLFE